MTVQEALPGCGDGGGGGWSDADEKYIAAMERMTPVTVIETERTWRLSSHYVIMGGEVWVSRV